MTTTLDEPSVPVCRRCRRPVTDHRIFADVPDPAERDRLTEADIPGEPWRGLYCPEP